MPWPHAEFRSSTMLAKVRDSAVLHEASRFDSLCPEFKGKKVVLIGVPGAFTPTCQKLHLSSFISEWAALSQKGISNVIVIASNDQWVMAAWGKANGVKNSDIVCPQRSLLMLN